MKVVIVGVGALGSHLVQFLRNEDVTLTLVDFDRVETKNVSSQFHSKATVGKKTVDSIKQSMQFLYGRKVITIGNKLTKDNVSQLLGSADLVVDCLDNGESRRVIQQYVREHDIACLHGALAADGAFGRVCWTEFFIVDDEDSVGTPTCEGGEHLPFIGVVSTYLALAVQRYLREKKKIGFQIHSTGAMRI